MLGSAVVAGTLVEGLRRAQLALQLRRTHIKDVRINIDGTSAQAFDSTFELSNVMSHDSRMVRILTEVAQRARTPAMPLAANTSVLMAAT